MEESTDEVKFSKKQKGQKVSRQETYMSTAEEIEKTPIEMGALSIEVEPVIPTHQIFDYPEVTSSTPSIITQLVEELRTQPSQALSLIQVLGKITKPWEPIGTDGNPVNEVPVPPGQSPKEFVKVATSTTHISGFRLTTIFGDEVAQIIKGSPKWRVIVAGEYQIDTPFVHHGQRAEGDVKSFAEGKLRERGYIIGF
jgi:hypothetical protein